MTKTKNGNSQTASTGTSIPQLNPPGKKQLITLDKLVWTRTKQKEMLEAVKRFILGLAGGFNFQRNMRKILKLKIRETKILFSD